ncbi:hypothetical protein ENUP19_0228G0010 [Entamoeba nuttalli]|uniref:DNA sliding clamp PCNA n=2 Tax=Entamoeba nuttalli TaxID=412467 RepID=K2G698_ENTNP|nr:proliferating cell nuclear antigen (pcna) protein [Entamoeba nuttalli P19]EKE37931.1 proliferating cell nuclear antigen (pcna) protein [Entamoeba nuttalli P19]|eukprot:XP_008859740.1 proliferating cell nuclear antigen (pcna) protein [Entamoeba nuttalli P19]
MCAFHAKFKEAALFKRVVESLKSTIDKTNFDCSDAGIAVQCMDNSHVSLVSLLIETDAFDEFQCLKPITLGINLTHLSKILKALDNDCGLILDVKKVDDAVLSITSEGTNKTMKFGLNLVDIEAESVEIPELQSDAIITLSSAEFLKITKDFSALGDDSISIGCTKNEVTLTTKGAMCETCMTLSALENVDSNGLQIEHNKDVTASFALKQISEFAKSAPLADNVKLSLSGQAPLIMEFKGEACVLKFYLAPKFDEEDEPQE